MSGSSTFNAATGTWDTGVDWTPNGAPSASSAVSITSATNLITAGGTDVFAQLQATGSAAGGGGNTLSITGTLEDTANNGGIGLISDFTIDVAHGATFEAPQLQTLSGSLLDISGTMNLFGGGGIAAAANSTIIVESGGTLAAQKIGADASDTLIVDGALTLNGGGAGLGAIHATINSGGVATITGTDNHAAAWIINGGTYIGSDAYPTTAFNFDGVAGGEVSLLNDARYGDGFTISSFTTGDTLILGSIAAGTVLTTNLSGTDLRISAGGNVVAEVTHFTAVAGTALGAQVINGQIVLDGCFYAGTRLATPDGFIAVEDVTAGTLLLTASGAAKPVRWLGRSTISTRFRDKLRALPIRIKAGALADNVPARDLLVSPCHAMFIGGVLIQAGALVNGGSIIRDANVPEVFTYYHVELDRHELLLAEGAPAESFIDNIDRMGFENWAEHEALGTTAPIEEMAYPRAKSHRQVPMAIRQMLTRRMDQLARDIAA